MARRKMTAPASFRTNVIRTSPRTWTSSTSSVLHHLVGVGNDRIEFGRWRRTMSRNARMLSRRKLAVATPSTPAKSRKSGSGSVGSDMLASSRRVRNRFPIQCPARTLLLPICRRVCASHLSHVSNVRYVILLIKQFNPNRRDSGRGRSARVD